MPIYEYRCSACDHLSELLLGINDPAPQFCPSCGAEGTMRKAFAAPTIHFKGSGWAKKDRSTAARSKSSAKDDDGGTSKADSASASDTKGDSKGDAKTEARSGAGSDGKSGSSVESRSRDTGSGTPPADAR
jgi:putative FmdB family regulatory protein